MNRVTYNCTQIEHILMHIFMETVFGLFYIQVILDLDKYSIHKLLIDLPK